MVYQGPSRGCISCKLRRKKCDETRPSCARCTRANRVCHGYETGISTDYEVYNPAQALAGPEHSIARKCSLPKRTAIPGSNVFTKDAIPAERSEEESNWLSFRCFLYDFCLTPTNRNISQGYLSQIENLAIRLGPESDLAKACEAVGFACHGKILCRPRLIQKAELFYQELLTSVSKAIGDPKSVDAPDLRLVATLLGLHQIVTAAEINPGEQAIHDKGLAALMQIEHSPLWLLRMAEHRSIASIVPIKVNGPFSVPSVAGADNSLVSLLLDLKTLWEQSQTSLKPYTSAKMLAQCIRLHDRFDRWQTSRAAEFKATTIGRIKKAHCRAPVAGSWPGPVHTYIDLYVGGVWNIFRTARLLLLTLLINTLGEHIDSVECQRWVVIGDRLLEDMAASVPYHLADNLPAFLGQSASGITEIADNGRLLGGLLLIHPLYAAFKTPFFSHELRAYMQECLKWIGSKMGLGQAAYLATDPPVDAGYLASSCMIVWSGFLGF